MKLVLVGNDFTIDLIKLRMASLFESKQEELKSYKPPKKEDFQTEEEYQKAYKEFMLGQIEYISNLKFLNFSSYLERYNEFLSTKRDVIEQIEKRKQSDMEDISKKMFQKKANIWISAVLSIIFPQGIIPFVAMGVGRNIIYNKTIKSDMEDLTHYEIAREGIEKTHTDIYDLCCELRSDYHKSKAECEELKKRALAGEDIIEELVKMMAPERISLQSPEQMMQLQKGSEEEPKIMIYKREKKSNE